MPTVGKVLKLPTGDVVEFLETSASTGGARVRARVLLKLGGLLAVAHIHRDQDEAYEVVSGRLAYSLDGKQQIAEAGTTVVLPRGVPHQHYCHGPDDTLVIQTMTPGLDFDYLLETVSGLGSGGSHRPDNLLQGLVWIRKLKGPLYLGSVPIWLQRAAATVLAPIAYLLGYRAVYQRFSGEEW